MGAAEMAGGCMCAVFPRAGGRVISSFGNAFKLEAGEAFAPLCALYQTSERTLSSREICSCLPARVTPCLLTSLVSECLKFSRLIKLRILLRSFFTSYAPLCHLIVYYSVEI